MADTASSLPRHEAAAGGEAGSNDRHRLARGCLTSPATLPRIPERGDRFKAGYRPAAGWV
jgi:hypothetical protein